MTRRLVLPVLTLFLFLPLVRAEQAQQARQPASRAAVVLTWDQAQRETGFASMERIFLTRTVRASETPRPLPAGRPLDAFAAGGARAADFERFVKDQYVSGVIVLHDGVVRLERYALTGGPSVRWHSFSVAKSVTSTLVGAAMKDGSIESLDDQVTRYITDLRGSAYDDVTVRQLLTMTSTERSASGSRSISPRRNSTFSARTFAALSRAFCTISGVMSTPMTRPRCPT